jgi:hypothetical protein
MCIFQACIFAAGSLTYVLLMGKLFAAVDEPSNKKGGVQKEAHDALRGGKKARTTETTP